MKETIIHIFSCLFKIICYVSGLTWFINWFSYLGNGNKTIIGIGAVLFVCVLTPCYALDEYDKEHNNDESN